MACTVKLITDDKANISDGDYMMLSNGKKRAKLFTLGTVAETEEQIEKVKKDGFTIDEVADLVVKMSKDAREDLTRYIQNAESVSMTAEDMTNFRLIGNTTANEIFTAFNLKQKYFPLSDTTLAERYNIVRCKSLKIAGRKYSGRIIDGYGNQTFVITDAKDARQFLTYLMGRELLNKMFKNGVIIEGQEKAIEDYRTELNAIKKRFYNDKDNVSDMEVLNDFIDNAGTFVSFKHNGKIIASQHVLNNIFHSLKGRYFQDYISSYDPFELDLSALREDKNDYSEWKIPKVKMYELLKTHHQEFTEKYDLDTFINFSGQEILKLFYGNEETKEKGLFYEHSKLIASDLKGVDVTVIQKKDSGGTVKDGTGLGKKFVSENWDAIRSGTVDEATREFLYSRGKRKEKVTEDEEVTKTLKSGEVKKSTKKVTKEVEREGDLYKSYDDLLDAFGDDLEKVVEIINKAEYGFEDEEGEKRILKAEVKKRTVEKKIPKLDENGKRMFETDENGKKKYIMESTGEKHTEKYIDYYFERPKKVREGKAKPSYFTFKFPWETLGGRLDFNMNTEYYFSAYDGEVGEYGKVNNGLYHGMRIYLDSREDRGMMRYIITRDIISPDGQGSRYSSADEAAEAIDRRNAEDKISDYALVSLKTQTNPILRNTIVERKGLKRNQILSVLDYRLNNKKEFWNLPLEVKKLFNETGEQFHEHFDEATGKITEQLYTPEMMATFLMEQYHDIYEINNNRLPDSKQKFINDIIDNYKKVGHMKMYKLAKEISNAKTINYIVDDSFTKKIGERSSKKGKKAIMANWSRADLRRTLNAGVDLDVRGDRFAENGRKIGEWASYSMSKAIEYINKKYGWTVKETTTEELQKNKEFRELGLDKVAKSVNAFVHNGQIYINTSIATQADLFQEMAHLFCATLKGVDFDKYMDMLDRFETTSEYANEFKQIYDHLGDTYKKMAKSDRMEEAFARLIGNKLYNNIELYNVYDVSTDEVGNVINKTLTGTGGFNEEVFEQITNDIIGDLQKGFSINPDVNGSDNELGFTKLIKYLNSTKSGSSKDSGLDYATLSNITKQLIIQGTDFIKENC